MPPPGLPFYYDDLPDGTFRYGSRTRNGFKVLGRAAAAYAARRAGQIAHGVLSETGKRIWNRVPSMPAAKQLRGSAGGAIKVEGIPHGSLLSDTMPHNSGKRGGGSLASTRRKFQTQSTNRATRVPVFTQYAKGGSRISMKSTRVSQNRSSLIGGAQFLDSDLLETLGENQLTSLAMTVGKAVYPDHIGTFLKQFLNHGVTRTSFAGRMISGQNQRLYHHQVFRHNLAANSGTTPAPYPPGMINRILTPQNPDVFTPQGDGSGGSTLAPGSQSFRDMMTGEVYYSPDNLSDLEDMSWNQNHFKITPNENATNGLVTKLYPDAALFVPNYHGRQSMLYRNNFLATGYPVDTVANRPKWKACINKGSIEYDFMNKGLGGAKVVVLVSKIKKSHLMPSNVSSYDSSASFPVSSSIDQIQLGWLATQNATASTEKYRGRIPSGNDVTINPAYTFLPELKRTSQAECDITEVSRQTFAMPSGSRRNVKINLPGLFYSPNDIPSGTLQTELPIMTEYTYIVTLATCGTVATAEYMEGANLQTQEANTWRVGDDFAESNIQFYATYSESIGPAVYEPPNKPFLYNNGGILPASVTPGGPLALTTGTMMCQADGVRIGPQHGGHITTDAAGNVETGTNISSGAPSMSNNAN